MTDITELKKSYWRDAAIAGGVIGLLIFVLTLVKVNIDSAGANRMLGLVEFLLFAYLIYYYARKRGLKYGNEGFSFNQSMGYILAMMLFTGFVVGVGNFLLSRFIAPEYYENAYQVMLEAYPMYDPDTEMGRNMELAVRMMQTNPIVNVVGGIISYVIYGGVLGLIASAFVKRKPDIFADNTPSDV